MSFRDLPETQEPQATHAEDLQSRLIDLEAALAPFEAPVWLMLKAQIQAQLAEDNANLIGQALSHDQLWQVRGRCQALQWVIGLPDQIQTEINLTMLDLERLQETEREDGDVEEP